MTRDPFIRLALLAACALYVGGLAAVDVYLSRFVAVAAAIGGLVGGVLLSLEVRDGPPAADGEVAPGGMRVIRNRRTHRRGA